MHRPFSFLRQFVLTLILALSLPALLSAQTTEDPKQDPIMAAVTKLQGEVRVNLEKAATSLSELEKLVEKAAHADGQLAQLKLKADEISKEILAAMANLQSRYNLVSKRLEELGAAPEDGAVEDVQVAADRKRLQGEKAQMNTILADADALKTEASRISNDITDKRRELFSEMLFRQTPITLDVVSETYSAARSETTELMVKVVSSLEFMWNFKRGSLLIALGLSLLAAIVFIVPVRMLFAPLIRRDSAIAEPSYIHRLSLAFWSTLVPAGAVAAFVLTSLVAIVYLNVLRVDIVEILVAILWMLAGVYFVWKLARAIFAPNKPQWRLVSVSDRGARLLVGFAVLLAGINGLNFVFGATNEALDSPVVLTIAKGFVSSVIIGVVLLLLSAVKPMQIDDASRETGAWPGPIRAFLIIAGLGLIITALLGYIGLSQFVATQIIVTGAIAVTMYIGFSSGQAVSHKGAFEGTAAGQSLAKRYGLSAIKLDQIGLAVGLAIYAAVVLIGLPLILLQWGFRAIDIWAMFVRLFTEIQVGSISISLVGIAVGILLFVAGLFGTRWFQRWLDGTVLERSEIDVGVRNSVNTGLGYLGVAIAAVIGVSAAGIDLSSLALVAGALSLGIGFGLQTIVQNFVSGLILLAERPFRVGDWVVNGTVEGFVRRISVRATEIETFRNQTVIVPNSQLINAAVGNWTLRNKLGRSEIPVSVSYRSDPRQVIDLLIDIAKAHPLVLTMPEPNVEFVRFGESSLDFELRFYLADLFTGLGVRNEIRFQIFERFAEEGIEFPFPQRNVTVHMEQGGPLANAGVAQDPDSDGVRKARRAELDRKRRAAETTARDIDSVEDNRHSHSRYDDEDEDGTEVTGR